ncbi:MAG: putative caspase-like protein/TPR repeat protein, partial [Paracoccaceae bacterium]
MMLRNAALAALTLSLLTPAVAGAQESRAADGDLTALVRGSGVIGLPDVTIDFDKRAERRFAIVVGNGAYDHVAGLKNAVSDARLVSDFLRGQGYVVLDRYDLTKRGFEGLLREALTSIPTDAEVVFYFAGHGLQIGRRNFIVPVDAELSNSSDVAYETVTLDSVVSILSARSRAQIVILDSCRDNPFANVSATTELGGELYQSRDGFTPMTAPVNTLLAYSTSPGAVALDGDSGNSPFTTAFVQIASQQSDKPASSVLEEVRRQVYTETSGRQVPWESSTLVEPIYFGGAAWRAASAELAQVGAGGATRSLRQVSSGPLAEPGTATAADMVAVSATLEREIRVGPAMRQALGLGPQQGLEIVSPPVAGRLALMSDTGWRSVGRGPVTAEELERLVFTPAIGQIPALGSDGKVSDSFEVVAVGKKRGVQVNMQADPCDLAAGDHLDPEGVGFVRYPNELQPDEARIACEASVARAPEVGRFHFQLGRSLLALRRFDEARAEYDKARDLGHTRAFYATGILEAQRPATTGGKAQTKVSDDVLVWYVLGSEKGDPYAYHALGKQLVRHETSDRLRNQGFDLLSRAIELGHTFAMNELGWFYLDEKSPYFAPDRGMRHLRESASRNDIYGYNNLGLVLRSGLGGQDKNPEAALAWFRKASEGGHPNAPTNIARMYADGEVGSVPEPVQAIRWYDEGLSRGDAWGGANGAWVIAKSKPKGFGFEDIAIRAGKAAALRNEGAIKSVEPLLSKLPAKFLDQASQMILRDMGAAITPDGAFGASSTEALLAAAARTGLTP